MHYPEYVIEKLLWDFEIQTDHLISTRRLDLSDSQQKKENLPKIELYRPGRPQNENKRKQKRDKYQDLAREIKKTWNNRKKDW